MSEVFYVRDCLPALAEVRQLLRARAQKIRDVGGDATLTDDHLERLEVLERFLLGECNVVRLQVRLSDYAADGRQRVRRAEVFKLMCGED